jgi:hypothetical protein
MVSRQVGRRKRMKAILVRRNLISNIFIAGSLKVNNFMNWLMKLQGINNTGRNQIMIWLELCGCFELLNINGILIGFNRNVNYMIFWKIDTVKSPMLFDSVKKGVLTDDCMSYPLTS